jgi:hypothetical protein
VLNDSGLRRSCIRENGDGYQKMAALVTVVFATSALRADKSVELRVVSVLAAAFGVLSLLTRPRGLADELAVGAYLLARLHHFQHHEEARILQILLLLVAAIVATVAHYQSVFDIALLLLHTGLTSIELTIRMGLNADDDGV